MALKEERPVLGAGMVRDHIDQIPCASIEGPLAALHARLGRCIVVGHPVAEAIDDAVQHGGEEGVDVAIGLHLATDTGDAGGEQGRDELALERLDAGLGCVLNPAGVVEEAEDVVAQLALAVLDGARLRLGECVVDLGLHGASVVVHGDELDVLRGVFDADA